ncbi:nucleotidyltransferase family protein [Novosphingobium sp. Leaf2]|uniref:nucleotidyltransferase family protein n=1 Tax=Novosphingobium sp. Leaf2 TaxID=1735670 RepID=UPI0006F202C8|nr:nucleotidyltransferase family protein [Novosphingobium sp. Leaf2]KQM19533.1 molybdopterin-guanine dinucleotide biosynthesis protein MobA [Novosphingobium sp. Leaf2]
MTGYVALVLAAGRATRFGSDKLAALLDGAPLLHHAIRAARAAPVDKVIVVTRPDARQGDWNGPPPVTVLPVASTALSTSLKAGIAACGDAAGAFVFLGDMPRIPHTLAAQLATAIGDGYAAVPCHEGQPGHPVLLSARAFADIAGLQGDRGAVRLLSARNDVVRIACADPAILFDVDRPEDLPAP